MLQGGSAAALPASSSSFSSSSRLASSSSSQARPQSLAAATLAPPAPRPVPRRVVAARRLHTALSRGDDDDDSDPEIAPYLWRCGGGTSDSADPLLHLPPPPEAWRALQRAAGGAAAYGTSAATTLMPPALLPLLAAPPSALLPERDVLLLPWRPSRDDDDDDGNDVHQPRSSGARLCQLSRRGLLSPVRDRALAEFFARLFEAAVVGRRRRRQGDASQPPPEIELSRHDLFHAHLFAAAATSSGNNGRDQPPLNLGLLFHAAEYPRRTRETTEATTTAAEPSSSSSSSDSSFPFPHDLGHCQRGSDLVATREALDWRNTVYFAGQLAAFSVAQGGPLRPLLRPGTAPLRTVYEEDLSSSFVAGDRRGWVGPDVLCFRARDVAAEGASRQAERRRQRSLLPSPSLGSDARRRLLVYPRSPLPAPVETSLGPLHVFVSY